MPKFEKVSADPSPQKRIEGMKQLISELPECNRYLVQWIFVHMKNVIEREKFNKMTIQNVSIVLSPTMKISHRVLNCLFENRHILFDGIQLKKYVPPITSESATRNLPDSPEAIEEEIRKRGWRSRVPACWVLVRARENPTRALPLRLRRIFFFSTDRPDRSRGSPETLRHSLGSAFAFDP